MKPSAGQGGPQDAMSFPLVGVKLCGGCREQYDRLKVYRCIQAACPQIRFLPVGEAKDFDLIIVISGCPVQCPDVKSLEGKAPMLRIWDSGQTASVIETLRQLIAERSCRTPAEEAAGLN